MSSLEYITQRVNRNGDPDDPATPTPLLTLEEFFSGNDISGSICCNLDPCPEPEQVHRVLQDIEQRENVHAVYVQITTFDDPDWPSSDTVWVITSASIEDVASWLPEKLVADEVWEGWVESQTYEPVSVPSAMKPRAIWWD